MAHRAVMSHEATVLQKRIVANDGDSWSFARDNSHVIIQTANIDDIVANGTSHFPYLIEIMQNQRISCDSFVRCYSACDQILRKIDPGIRVNWTGGAELTGDLGEYRVEPGRQLDGPEFRKWVTTDIIAKAEQLCMGDAEQSVAPATSRPAALQATSP
jgi:hypothetical protein